MSPLTLDTLPDAAQVTPGRSLVALRRAVARSQYMYPCETKRYVALQTEEKTVQASLKSYAQGNGWRYTHFHDSRREVRNKKTGESFMVGDKDARDCPDTILIRGPRLIWVECKKEDQPVEGGQLEYLAALIVAGAEVYILRPSGLSAIQQVLA